MARYRDRPSLVLLLTPKYAIVRCFFIKLYFQLLIIWLIGFSIIVIKCLYKTLSYVDSIVDASALLISDKEEDIVLPEDLLDVEKRMNQILTTWQNLTSTRVKETCYPNEIRLKTLFAAKNIVDAFD